jgi:hypothetical protein
VTYTGGFFARSPRGETVKRLVFFISTASVVGGLALGGVAAALALPSGHGQKCATRTAKTHTTGKRAAKTCKTTKKTAAKTHVAAQHRSTHPSTAHHLTTTTTRTTTEGEDDNDDAQCDEDDETTTTTRCDQGDDDQGENEQGDDDDQGGDD